MLETVFVAVLVVSCVAFVMFLWRMSRTVETPKFKRKKTRKRKTKTKHEPKTKEVNGVEIPKEWREKSKSNPRPSFKIPSEVRGPRRKIRVPGLRASKRVLAGILLLINFFISQASLLSAPATQPMFWLFFFNSLILIDYLWKTRRREPI